MSPRLAWRRRGEPTWLPRQSALKCAPGCWPPFPSFETLERRPKGPSVQKAVSTCVISILCGASLKNPNLPASSCHHRKMARISSSKKASAVTTWGVKTPAGSMVRRHSPRVPDTVWKMKTSSRFTNRGPAPTLVVQTPKPPPPKVALLAHMDIDIDMHVCVSSLKRVLAWHLHSTAEPGFHPSPHLTPSAAGQVQEPAGRLDQGSPLPVSPVGPWVMFHPTPHPSRLLDPPFFLFCRLFEHLCRICVAHGDVVQES